MGFFAEFNVWLNALLQTYIAQNAARIAGALEPLFVTLATLYVMIWGFMHLTGQAKEPVVEGFKRIAVVAFILGAAIKLWLYNQVIVDSFFNGPSQLAAAVIGAYRPVGIVDEIIFLGGDAGASLIEKGGIFDGNFAFYLAGMAVYLIVGLTAVYTIFLLTLSHIALSVLLALGPLFIGLLFFQTTKRFFEAWIAQLANYAFITILTVLVAALMLTMLTVAARQAVSAGGDIQIAHAVRLCMAAGLTFLVMRQVMPMSAGLASGLALSTYGLVSSTLSWGLGQGRQFSRGVFDGQSTRWDPLSRRAGYLLSKGVRSGVSQVSRNWRENSIRG